MTDTPHPNLQLLQQFDINNLDSCADILAENFTWHYFNPQLPELEGAHKGLDGLKNFFSRLAEISDNSFQVSVVDGRTVGDELVFTQTLNRITMQGKTIEFDVVVVWRIVENKIAEAWDIPSVFTEHKHASPGKQSDINLDGKIFKSISNTT